MHKDLFSCWELDVTMDATLLAHKAKVAKSLSKPANMQLNCTKMSLTLF